MCSIATIASRIVQICKEVLVKEGRREIRDAQRSSYRYTTHLQPQQACCSSIARPLLLFLPYETKRFRGEDKEGA